MSDNVVTETEGGTPIVRTAEDAAIIGAQIQDPSVREAAMAEDRRRLMFDTGANAATTFAEGVIDALSIGLIRETGDAADLRRDVNSGWAVAGNAVGFVAGMGLGGPVRGITRAAERAGEKAARAVLKSEGKSIAVTAAREASASAALAGGQAFGHQLMDTLIEDKEFSSEAILDEVKLAGIMGAVGGVALGGLSKLAARKSDIAAQGGLMSLDDAIKPHREATRAYDGVVERHAAEVGAMRAQHAEGLLDADLLRPRTEALTRAVRARDALDAINESSALSGANDALYKKWQRAGVRYRAAVRELDAVMEAGVPVHTGDLSKLNRAIEQIPVKTDTPAVLRFADTTAERPAIDFAEESLENPANYSHLEDLVRMQREASAEPLGKAGLRANKGRYTAKGPEPIPEVINDPTPPSAVPEAIDADPMYAGVSQGEYPLSFPAGDVVPASSPRAPSANITRRADMSTRELAVDPEMVGTSRAGVKSVNDLPDYHTPLRSEMVTNKGGAAPVVDDVVQAPEPQSFFEVPPAKVRPLDQADARARAVMEELSQKAGGRLDSAGALGLLDLAGIRPAADNVGAYMDQVYAMRKAARAAAEPGRKTLKGALGAALAGGAIGGPAGAVAAVAADLLYLKRGGQIASAAGRLASKVTGAASKLLSSTRVRAAAAAAANIPHAYSDRGPIKDPVERIQEIQFLAAHPDAIMERVAASSQDLADQPELLAALQQRAVNQVQRLAVRAPAIYFDKLGRPLSPPQGRLRDFFEYENAVHDLGSVLDAIGNGVVTKAQTDALRDNWTSVSIKMASAFMVEPEKLQKLGREKLRVIEMVTGMKLTGASDPMFLARQGAAWQPPMPPTPSSKAQAFNINPAGAPTPSQATATGKAPGN